MFCRERACSHIIAKLNLYNSETKKNKNKKNPSLPGSLF